MFEGVLGPPASKPEKDIVQRIDNVKNKEHTKQDLVFS